MNPAVFIRASARRGLASQSLRSFASKPPSQPPKAPELRKDSPTVPPRQDAAVSKTEPAVEESAAEVNAKRPISSLPSLDFAPGEEPHRERTGAKSSKDSLSSIERKRRMWGRVTAGMMIFGAVATVYNAGREWEDAELQEMRMVRVVVIVCVERS
jgi:mitochondrial import inner membrane translocase subunit TIM50